MQGRKLETELKQKPWTNDAYLLVPPILLSLLSYTLPGPDGQGWPCLNWGGPFHINHQTQKTPDRLAGRQSDGEIFLMEILPYTIPAFFQVVNNSNEDDYDDDDDDDNNNNKKP